MALGINSDMTIARFERHWQCVGRGSGSTGSSYRHYGEGNVYREHVYISIASQHLSNNVKILQIISYTYYIRFYSIK